MNVTNRPDGLKFSKKIFGKKVSIVPYVMPGFGLAKKINEVYSMNPNIDCLILMNHGIFTFANNAKKAYSLMIKYVSKAEKAVKKLKVKKIKQINNFSTRFDVGEVAPILRGLLSEQKDQKFIVNYRINNKLKYFINGQNIKVILQKVPLHLIMLLE